VKMVNVSRTVGEDRIVEELFISFTHTTVIDCCCRAWRRPGAVEMAVAVIVGSRVIKSLTSTSIGIRPGCRADRIA